MKQLALDGRSLALGDFKELFRGEDVQLSIAAPAMAAVARARALVEKHVAAGDVVYGLTTGFGKLKSVAIARADLVALQTNLVLSHCCGVGAPMPIAEVRAAQVLRLNGLVRGHSGVRPEVCDFLVRLFNKRFVPVVPQQGSVGASGDLAPLAHMAAATMGHGEAYVDGVRMSAAAALAKVGEKALVLEAKEGLALINGTEIMKAIAVGILLRAANLSRAADAIASLSVEALQGSAVPFDARFAELKGHSGHRRTSDNLRRCLADSAVMAGHADCDRVQDPYSLRCIPQVHGSFKTALEHVESVLAHELNAVTDNPILFPDTDEVLSAGQFHGQPISVVMDYLAIALCTLANISERRIEQLVNPDLSRLPAFLVKQPGLHSGMMIAQVAAASLASENKSLAHPASVDSIPTSANQEDHVSMGVTAARKARAITDNVEYVLAIEALCAAQAREFHKGLRAGRGAQAVHECLRKRIAPNDADRFLHTDIEAARELLVSGALCLAVDSALGRGLDS
ncbi:MAG TPA: histidine ammonia-lyase [Planctomycetota bacterium]|nr:histidine ammonia-lyase [Planctomycetota bacterium]